MCVNYSIWSCFFIMYMFLPQIEVLSQRLNAKDKQISEISAKNEVLSEDLKNVWSKFSEMQLQIQVQLQRLEEEQKKNFDCCQQVRNHFQRCGTPDAKGLNIMFISTYSDKL